MISMRVLLGVMIIGLLTPIQAASQPLAFPKAAAIDPGALAKAMPNWAKTIIDKYREEDREQYLANRFRLQMIAEQYAEANATLASLRNLLKTRDPLHAHLTDKHYELFCTAKLLQTGGQLPFPE